MRVVFFLSSPAHDDVDRNWFSALVGSMFAFVVSDFRVIQEGSASLTPQIFPLSVQRHQEFIAFNCVVSYFSRIPVQREGSRGWFVPPAVKEL